MGNDKLTLDSLSEWLNTPVPSGNMQKTPLVILSFAVSLDGSIAAEKGFPYKISCTESEEAVHYIRSFCDALLTGIGTILSDNPRLTVRMLKGDSPVPVVIDSSLRIPPDSNILKNRRNPLIFCAENPDSDKKAVLEKKGAVVIESSEGGSGLELSEILKQLYMRGVKTLMVEGGGGILTSFIEEKLWDKMAVTVSPSLIGGYRFFKNGSRSSSVVFKNCRWVSSGIDQICLINRESI